VSTDEEFPLGNPAEDPIGTVRIHPDDRPEDPEARRRIAVFAQDYAEEGDYWGCRWQRFTTDMERGPEGHDSNTDPIHSDDVVAWPVQPLHEVAWVLFGDKDVRAPTPWAHEQVLRVFREYQEGIDDLLNSVLGPSFAEAEVAGGGTKKRIAVLAELCAEAKEKFAMDDLLNAHDWSRGTEGMADLFSALASRDAEQDQDVRKGLKKRRIKGGPPPGMIALHIPVNVRLSSLQRAFREVGLKLTLDLDTDRK
jgi:hypothetical protein